MEHKFHDKSTQTEVKSPPTDAFPTGTSPTVSISIKGGTQVRRTLLPRLDSDARKFLKCVTHVVYHSPCPDGHTSRMLVERALRAQVERTARVTWVPASHGSRVFAYGRDDVVLFLDYTYARDIMLALEAKCARVLVIDHHKSAIDRVSPGSCHCIDTNHAACSLVYSWLYPGEKEQPHFVKLVEDYDLFRHQYEESDALNLYMAVSHTAYDYAGYQRLLDQTNLQGAVVTGRGYIKLRDFQVAEIAKRAVVRYTEDGLVFLSVNSTVWKNEIADYLFANSEFVPDFVAVYHIDDTHACTRICLRSNTTDVEKIARAYGGGGHRSAASFSLPAGETFGVDAAGFV